MDASNESLKLNKINTYKALIKRKKYTISIKGKSNFHNYISWILRSFGSKFNTKENNRIPLRDWNSYLKILYEFHNAMDTIPIVPTKEEVFSLDDIEFGVKRLASGKAKDIEGY